MKNNNQDSAGIRKYEELTKSFKNREFLEAMERTALGDTRMPLLMAI